MMWENDAVDECKYLLHFARCTGTSSDVGKYSLKSMYNNIVPYVHPVSNF